MAGASRQNHDGRRFQNSDPGQGFAFADFLKWRWQRRAIRHERIAVPMARPANGLTADPLVPTITWLGHASLLVQYDGINVLTDPHLGKRASPVWFAGPRRVTPPGLTVDELPRIDAIVMSHNHYDHLDSWTIRQIRRRHLDRRPTIFVPSGLGHWFRRRGFNDVRELHWWESCEWRDWTIHAVPAQHFSGRGPGDHNRSLWAGWVLERGEFRFYFAGDTGWSQDFVEIGERLAPMSIAAIPIAAYEPRWIMKPVHINPEEAVKIHQAVSARQSLAVHWGTFLLTDEAADEPPKRLAAALDAAGVPRDQFWLMQHGETRQLSS